MKKSYFKKLVPGLGLLLLILGCQRDDICPENTQTTPMLVLSFFDANERENPKSPTNLSIRAVVNDSVKTLYQRINEPTIAIPLKTNQTSTTYTFTIFDPRNENDEQEFIPDTDTLTFTYGTEEVYINRACAYKVIYNSLKLTVEGGEEGEWIESYSIVEPDIEDDTEAHINIFF